MFSRRSRWDAPENRLTAARRDYRGALLDLTESNPTRAAIAYPTTEVAEALARGAAAPYEPDPRGLPAARETLAAHLGCSPDDLVITASTSEAYSFLFKLLTDPGDAIVTATPSYPLIEQLAQLELIEQRTFALDFHRRWEVDVSRIACDGRTRALLVVNPNNPTGSYVTADEQEAIASLGLPIVSDEVFLEYPLNPAAPPQSFVRDDVLAFVLGGLSKLAGLPHLKLGWIRVSGPERQRREAIAALELIADNFLSVATPVQVALGDLLRIAPRIREAILIRLRENLETLTRAVELLPAARLLPVEGGWTAVVRVPRVETDEELALRLLRDHGVVVHPGYFFDFPTDGYFVVSLLTRPDVFVDGASRIVDALR